MQGMVVGGAGLAMGFGRIGDAQAKSGMIDLAALDKRALHETGMDVLKNSSRVAVPSYRFGVVMRSGISASGDAGNVSMEASAELVGLSLEQMRRIAGLCLADFVAQIQASGRTVIPSADVVASSGYRKIEPSPIPFVKKPFADARTVAIVAPEGMPLVSQHSDAPLSDKSPMSLGNWRAINQMCVDLSCVVLIPTLVIDFAELSGSGHSVFGGSASVGVKPGLFLVPISTYVSAHYAKIALAGPGGKMILEQRVAIGQAGDFVKTSTVGNRAEVEWWNAMASNSSSDAGRPTRAFEMSAYEYRVEPEAFSQAALAGAQAMHRQYAAAALQYPGKS